MRIFGLDVHRTFAEVALLDERGVRSAGRIDLIADALHTFGRQLTLDDDVVLEAVPTGSWNGRCSSAPLAVTVAGAEGARAVGRRPADILHDSPPAHDPKVAGSNPAPATR